MMGSMSSVGPDQRTGVPPVGRFAPSPTGPLHLGNLRTALVAWLSVRARGGRFVVRMEDLDRVTASREHEVQQLADLAALGLHHDGEVVRQSDRFALHHEAIDRLTAAGLTYPCYCSRREIREAAAAPHGDPVPEGAYPGTCRLLTEAQRSEREAAGRRPALRLRAEGVDPVTVHDRLAGRITSVIDDVVLRRNDGVPAYNLAVVVDDHLQKVTEVVRGDDLLSSTPRQVHLQRLLGLDPVSYLHVPLVLGPDGERLAKRHGAVTLADLAAQGLGPPEVISLLAASLGLADPGEHVVATDLVERFDVSRLPRVPWRWHPG
jgi:glutamyl-tRNA synthetase